MEATLARLKAFSARIDALEAAHKCVFVFVRFCGWMAWLEGGCVRTHATPARTHIRPPVH